MHKLSTSVRSTHGQDGAVVLDIRQGQIFNLNSVGSRILELLENGIAEPEIADIISREFGASKETVIQDLQEFIYALMAKGLVEKVN